MKKHPVISETEALVRKVLSLSQLEVDEITDTVLKKTTIIHGPNEETIRLAIISVLETLRDASFEDYEDSNSWPRKEGF